MSPFVDVEGRPVWHEAEGDGPAAVLLHGGLAGASTLAAQADALATSGHRVYRPERRGHGHTPDVDEPLTYSGMADETIAYLDEVVREPAALIGWSDGAVVALLVALRRPDLVTALGLIGQYFNASGRVEGGVVETAFSDPGAKEWLREWATAEQPELDFDRLFERITAMWSSEPELDLARVGAVRAPVLVLQGDHDDVRLEHSIAVAGAMPRARLAVLPGTHMLPIESPELVNALLCKFLEVAEREEPWAWQQARRRTAARTTAASDATRTTSPPASRPTPRTASPSRPAGTGSSPHGPARGRTAR